MSVSAIRGPGGSHFLLHDCSLLRACFSPAAFPGTGRKTRDKCISHLQVPGHWRLRRHQAGPRRATSAGLLGGPCSELHTSASPGFSCSRGGGPGQAF